MTRALFLLFTTALLFSNCRKNTYETTPKDIGHSYLPLNVGNEFVYGADSVKYGFTGSKASGDTISFFIKDLVVSKIEDSSSTNYTIARYHSKDTINWIFIKNHFYEVEKLRINHKENSAITTPLVFPVAQYYYWNGNELNNNNPKEYEYTLVNFDFKMNSKIYPSSIKVKMDSIDNLRERKIETEIYSKNIGLVYSEVINVSLINNDSLNDKGQVVLQRPPKIEKGIIFTKGLIYSK
ncbi:MAG: hypothetical protein ACKVQB_06105 [Bacteroidia bacterium]